MKNPRAYWLQCYWCRKDYLAGGKSHRSSIKKGRTLFFCARSCAAAYRSWMCKALDCQAEIA